MSKLMIASDLHLGHRAICKYRTQFSSAEEHHQTLFENLARGVNKADTLYLLGDIAFTREWLDKVGSIKCRHKKLILGNHDTQNGITIKDLANTYDSVNSLLNHKGTWFSHAPIHPTELRGKFNVHGHTHNVSVPDRRYINACVEHTNWQPIYFNDLKGVNKLVKVSEYQNPDNHVVLVDPTEQELLQARRKLAIGYEPYAVCEDCDCCWEWQEDCKEAKTVKEYEPDFLDRVTFVEKV